MAADPAAVGLAADDDQRPARGQRPAQPVEGTVAGDVEDEVVAVDPVGGVLAGVVHGPVGAEGADQVRLGSAAHRGDVCGPERLGQLDGVGPDPARGADHQDPQAGLQPAGAQGLEGRGRRDGDDGRLFGREPGRPRRQLVLLGAGVLREGAGAGAVHLVARAQAADAGSDRLDAACDVQTADPLSGRPQAEARCAQGVGHARHEVPDPLVEAGRLHPQEDLARPGDGLFGLFEAQDVGRSVRVLDDGSHRPSPSLSVLPLVGAEYWKTLSSGTPNTRAIWKAISSEGE